MFATEICLHVSLPAMKISLEHLAKKYNREWIFKDITYAFNSGNYYAIKGPNGSGKSTLLQVIAGSTMPTKGAITYSIGENNSLPVTTENIYKHLAIAAPYLELIEEMTVTEFLHFHFTFKPVLEGISLQEILQLMQLENAAHKQIRYYSSGMKQRVKLAAAFFTQVPILLLDEPCTNLDESGFMLYYHLIQQYTDNRLVIVCSNDDKETSFCKEVLHITDYK